MENQGYKRILLWQENGDYYCQAIKAIGETCFGCSGVSPEGALVEVLKEVEAAGGQNKN